MATLAEMREGLAANLNAIPNIQVNAYALSDPTPPTIDIIGGPILYDEAMVRGVDETELRVRVLVPIGSDVGAQKLMDSFCGPSGASSVKAQAETDRTLGGKVATLRVTTATEEQRVVLATTGVECLQREFTVTIHG